MSSRGRKLLLAFTERFRLPWICGVWDDPASQFIIIDYLRTSSMLRDVVSEVQSGALWRTAFIRKCPYGLRVNSNRISSLKQEWTRFRFACLSVRKGRL